MKVHPIIASAVVTAIFALQGWMLFEISTLEKNVAVLSVEVHMIQKGDTKQIAKQ